MIEIMNKTEIPDWVIYPQEYIYLVESEKDTFLPWYLLNRESLLIRNGGLVERYPARQLFAFARDDDSDDIACWEKDKPGKVVIIHDFASPGWEQREEFDSFSAWYNYVRTLMY